MHRSGWFEVRRVGAVLAMASLYACTMQSTNRTMWEETEEGLEDVEVKKPKELSSASADAAPPAEETSEPEPTAPPPSTGPAVTGFTLINADSDAPVAGFDPIADGATLTRSGLPTNLNVRANTELGGGAIGSVRFTLDGATVRIEGAAPYALGGDADGDYAALTPPLAAGQHTLVGTPFSGPNGEGTEGRSKTLTFTVQ